MKNLIPIILILTSVDLIYAQSKEPALELNYTYENIGNAERRKVKLIFRNQESLTSFSAKDTAIVGEPKDFDIGGEDDKGRQVYKNSITGQVIFRDFMPRDGEFVPCIVADPMKPLNWSFSSKVKKIGKYRCSSASTEFRGRKYVAWYTEDIPVTHGPWKFAGLPGAIIEVYTDDRSHLFTLISINSLQDAEIKPPSDAQPVAMGEYVTKKEQAVTDFINRLAAALPRGAEITGVSTGDNNLETDFSDVVKK